MLYVTIRERKSHTPPSTHHLTKSDNSLGRWEKSDVVLPKNNVSKKHARLQCREGRTWLTDLQSTNRTYVNGQPIKSGVPHEVKATDLVVIGDYELGIALQAPQGFVAKPVGAQPKPQAKQGPTPPARLDRARPPTGPSFGVAKPPKPKGPPPPPVAPPQLPMGSWQHVTMEAGPGYSYTAIPQGWLLLSPSGDFLFLSDPTHKQSPQAKAGPALSV